MTPYYEDDHVTIYHGDCLEIMDGLEFDVIVTDPPYGIGWALDAQIVGHGSRRRERGGHCKIEGDDAPFDPSPFVSRPAVLFGANHYASRLPDEKGWIAWDKTDGGRGPRDTFADVELAWTNCLRSPIVIRHLWKGLVRGSEAGNRVLHPTQKPVALFAAILQLLPDGVILDPFMGSGPTLRAAKDLGRKAIGIEIDERYCEIAAKRMGQEVLPL